MQWCFDIFSSSLIQELVSLQTELKTVLGLSLLQFYNMFMFLVSFLPHTALWMSDSGPFLHYTNYSQFLDT